MQKTVLYIMDADWEPLPETCERARKHLEDARNYCRRAERKQAMDRLVWKIFRASLLLFGGAVLLGLLCG